MADNTHTLDPATVYRDATFSLETRRNLELVRRLLHGENLPAGSRLVAASALNDVVDRWDANDATEIVFEDGVAS